MTTLATHPPTRATPAASVPEFRTQRRTRVSDLDRFGRVHNLSLIRYIEDAQVELAAAGQPDERVLDVGWSVVQRDTTFLVPVPMLAEPVGIATTVARLGRSEMTLATRIEHRGVVHVRSLDRFLACDHHGMRRRLDDGELRWLRRWMVGMRGIALGVGGPWRQGRPA
ncbi:acyl-CoA thioesterase [Embleya sp. MST-111070]|uniref:acyl-CoA thioesterase n=1 Tax=Embleya sp. MST-111070 TaxID=3398231 RepID=UPI003F73B39A